MVEHTQLTSQEFDIHVGLSYAGTEEQYLRFLRRYFAMVEEKTVRIKQCCEQGDIENYTIEVHALKSNSGFIGAIALAKQAAYLEQCGLKNQIDEIKAKTPELLESYQKVRDLFSFVSLEDDLEEATLDISTNDLQKKYDVVIDYLDNFDIDRASEILDSLMNYKISARQTEFIIRTKKKMVDFEYEKAMDILKSTKEALVNEEMEKMENINLRILIVDDNDMNREMAKELITDIGASTVAVGSGLECIRELKNSHFDFVIIDQMMPEMNGEQTLFRIRNEKLAEGTPIIVLTADTSEGCRDKYLTLGFDEYLPKPIIMSNLCDILRKYKNQA